MYKIKHYETSLQIKTIEGFSLNRINETLKENNSNLTILSFLKKKNQQKTNKELNQFNHKSSIS
jgi:hypothetical protein